MNKRIRMIQSAVAAAIAAISMQSGAFAQGLMENFDTVVGGAPTIVLDGSGFSRIDDWDSGIVGESAFAGTNGNITTLIRAYGLPAGGVGASGAGAIDFEVGSFNVIDQQFSGVAGTGGGVFLAGGAGADTFNFAAWDDNLNDEFAFGGTFDGAVLDGNMSAQGVLAGGNPGGFAQIDVDNVSLNAGGWFAGLQFDIGAFPGAPALLEGGFEGDAAGQRPTTWSNFGSGVFVETVTPRTGAQDLKLYEFNNGQGAGVFQDLPAEPGQVWELDGFVRTNAGDAITGTDNYAVFKIEFRAENDTLLAETELSVINGTSPTDVWIDAPAIQAIAPPNTATVRPLVIYVYPGACQCGVGAVFVDDLTFKLVSGPQPVTLDSFALSADVRGTVDAVGETLGDVQLRIEDNEGNRIQFTTGGTTGWQSLGGALDTGVEADASGTPTPGAFNLLSPNFHVVVAFNNETTPWGTGGTLDLDNLVLTNQNPAGSGFDAGLVFDQISVMETDPSLISLTADVFGDTAGGEYQLKITALDLFDTGLDEDFESVVDTTEIVFLDVAAINATQPNAFSSTAGWSDDIDGEQAFAGISGLVDTVSFTPRAYAHGIDSAGCGGSTHAGELGIESVSTNGAWFGGLNWPGQKLASTDFSQVQLTACIRGLEDPSDPFMLGQGNGFLGPYELRIEDADGDRLYFPMSANGTWQQVGGPLSSATFGTALDGVSNGIFDVDLQDPDSLSYSVVVSFIDPESTWFSGGLLQVDDLFLTPVQASATVAEFVFNGVADGSTFQTIGGALTSSDGPIAVGDLNQGFESATGLPGGIPAPAAIPFDDGLDNEFAFFGTFGDALVNGGATVGVCGTCGASSSKAVELTISDVPPNTGGWFAGVFLAGVPADLSGDLSQVVLSGEIKGEVNGGVLGPYELRIEDADTTALTFRVDADGTFQSVGGPLSSAMTTNADPNASNGVFDYNQATYNVTIAFVGTGSGTDWGQGGKLTIDNLFLTGKDLSNVDEYEVSLTFRNELASWPNGDGQLVIDNLNVSEGASPVSPGDVNCDGSVNGLDVQAFATAILDPGGYAAAYPGCNILNADTNSDSSATAADVASFAALLVSP